MGLQRTALYWACTRGNEAAAKVLMEKGAKVAARNKHGLNCLDIAVDRGHEYVEHCTIFLFCILRVLGPPAPYI